MGGLNFWGQFDLASAGRTNKRIYLIHLSMLILIIGIPITGLFLFSVKGIALVEGRIVEALLGVWMTQKTIFVSKELGWFGKLKALFTESQTWKALIYMILHLPFGLIYFTMSRG